MSNRIGGEREWFNSSRYGVFIHFGLYTLLGGNENDCRRNGRTKTQYAQELMPRFNPAAFDADAWVELLHNAGARYFVITTKHLEGFCLWDTRHTDYKVTRTPFKRDLVAELSAAAHRKGMRLGFYYSAEDWGYDEDQAITSEGSSYSTYFEAQIEELLTNYGQVDVLWLDCHDPRLNLQNVRRVVELAHRLQPSIVVNDRGVNHSLERNCILGDYVTPERQIPDYVDADAPMVECCDAMGRLGWGYYRGQSFWSGPELVRRLTRVAALGGNYLLNIEPQDDGQIRPECVERLRYLANWFETYGSMVFGSKACPLLPLDAGSTHCRPLGVATAQDHQINVLLHDWPCSDTLLIKHLRTRPITAKLIGSTADIAVTSDDRGVRLSGLPLAPLNEGVSAIVLEFDQHPELDMEGIISTRRPRTAVTYDSPVELLPDSACLFADGGVPWHRINRFDNGRVSIGHMIRLDCQVSWDLEVERAGVFDVYADLGTAAVQANARFSITVAGQTLEGQTVENGCYDEPKRLGLGRLAIPLGSHRMVLRIASMKQCFSDIHRILLVPSWSISPDIAIDKELAHTLG